MTVDISRMLNALWEEVQELKDDTCNKIFMIMINYFNDGECVDLGTKIVVCDDDEENFKKKYYSFTINNVVFQEEVLGYIKQDGIVDDVDHEYFRQQELAKILLKALQECDWIDDDTLIDVEAYD